MDYFDFFTDYIVSIFIFLTLDLFVNSFSVCQTKEKQRPIKLIFLIVCFFSYFCNSPYYEPVLLFRDFLYIILICKESFNTKIKTLFKYELYYIIASTVLALTHTLFTWDMYIYSTNKIYANYTSIIGNFNLYIILSMYVILKKLSDFPSSKVYKRYFLGTTGLSVALLILCSMLLGSTIIDQEKVVLLLFSVLLIVTMLCISIYKRVISILEENTIAKIEIEKNALEQEYYAQVQEGLKNLSLLRHDFKNHLAVLQGYATSGRTEELQSYISRLSDELTPATLIATPSLLLSAIINTKNEECKKKGITLSFEQKVTGIYLDEFHMVTIFSNMLDNAITAASKCDAGAIRLRLISVGSYLDIDCVNNHKEQIIKKDGRFHTTKPEGRELHGLGIQSIRRAVKEMNGELTIDYSNDSFHVNILVPNYL